MNDSAPLVHARGVRKRYGELEVLRGVDLDVYNNQVMCILGPSGSGKSTFLRCINNLETIDAGLLTIAGKSLAYERRRDAIRAVSAKLAAERRREIGMVFQSFNLFPHLTVLENVELAPVLTHHVARPEIRDRALGLLDQVGLADKADSRPEALSGGQQQRVAIARALAMRPQLMLFDEPTSALDPELVGEVLAVMRTLASNGMTMVIVTHEVSFAEEVADILVLMDAGRVLEQGDPAEIVSAPRTERGAQFLRRIIERNQPQSRMR